MRRLKVIRAGFPGSMVTVRMRLFLALLERQEMVVLPAGSSMSDSGVRP